MDDLQRGARTPRADHVNKAREFATSIGRALHLGGAELDKHVEATHLLLLPTMQQLADQNADIGEALYALQLQVEADTSKDWRTIAHTYINALNPEHFPFPPAA